MPFRASAFSGITHVPCSGWNSLAVYIFDLRPNAYTRVSPSIRVVEMTLSAVAHSAALAPLGYAVLSTRQTVSLDLLVCRSGVLGSMCGWVDVLEQWDTPNPGANGAAARKHLQRQPQTKVAMTPGTHAPKKVPSSWKGGDPPPPNVFQTHTRATWRELKALKPPQRWGNWH